MMSHLFLYKECGSLLILSFTSSIGKCNTALVILAIALFSRSWFPLFRILPQTASWYQHVVWLDSKPGIWEGLFYAFSGRARRQDRHQGVLFAFSDAENEGT